MNFYIYIVWSPPPIRGILSFYLGIENLGLSLDFSPPFVTRNQDISLSLELTGKPCLTTYRAKSRGYCGNGKFYHLVRTFFFNHFSWFLHLTFTYITLFLFWFCSFWSSWVKESILRSSSDHLAFAWEIEDFDDLINPHHLFDCCLGLEPTEYVLEKIYQEEKIKFVFIQLFIFYFFSLITHLSSFISKNGH